MIKVDEKEFNNYEDAIKYINDKKRKEEKDEFEKRRKLEEEKLKKVMTYRGISLSDALNNYIVLCNKFREDFCKVDGFDKWESLLIDDKNSVKSIMDNKSENKQVEPSISNIKSIPSCEDKHRSKRSNNIKFLTDEELEEINNSDNPISLIISHMFGL